MFATEPIADFGSFLAYCPSNNPSLDHDVKGKFVPPAKPIVFGTNGKSILCWSMFAIEPVAHSSLLPNIDFKKMGHVTMIKG